MSEKMHRPSPESNRHELNRSIPSQEDAAKMQPKKTDTEIEEADKGNESMNGGVDASRLGGR